MSKISIAMTTYNGEKYIQSQMESLMRQTRLPDEIIISDDCSKDHTIQLIEEVLKRYEYVTYKIIKNDKNLGYIRNFYQSISMTSGDMIFLCDQDDIWLEDKLEKMERLFEANSGVLSLNGSFDLIDSGDKPIPYQCHRGAVNNDLLRGKYPENQMTRVPYSTVLKYNISPGCTLAFRKTIRDQFLEKSRHILPHDWEINLIAAMNNGLYFYNCPVIHYRIHEKNTLGMNTDDSISEFEFKNNIDFRKAALEDRKSLRKVALQWSKEIPLSDDQKRSLKYVLKYDQYRMQCVFEHKFTAWFKLVYQTLRIWDGKHVRFKTLFGDFYYIWKR